MRANPVLLPPPYWVRKPKTETWSLLDLYRSASLSRSSSLETLARLGWRTSLLKKKINHQHAVYSSCWVASKNPCCLSDMSGFQYSILNHTQNIIVYTECAQKSIISIRTCFLLFFLVPPLECIRPYPFLQFPSFFHSFQLGGEGSLHDHLLTSKQGVADELASPQGNGSVGHGCRCS